MEAEDQRMKIPIEETNTQPENTNNHFFNHYLTGNIVDEAECG